MDLLQILGPRGRSGLLLVEGRDLELTAAFLGAALAGVVDDQGAHHLGGVGHEAAFVGEDRALALGHVEVRLVEEGRDAERQAGAPSG